MDADETSSILEAYYERFFPASPLFDWLSGGDPDAFSRREFAYTLLSQHYVRYLSFPTAIAWHQSLMSRIPERIHIGATYVIPPRTVAMVDPEQFRWASRELVFDVDADAYNDVRACGCRGSPRVCATCWRVLMVAVESLDAILRSDFGFQHIAWFSSGRRGIHGWVCDRRAQRLSAEARSALVSYLTVSPREAATSSVVFGRLQDVYKKTLLPYVLDTLVRELGILADDAWIEHIREHVRGIPKSWAASHDGDKNWKALPLKQQFETAMHLAYPRIDAAVTKQPKHLLKAPFSVHPATGNVCVPLDPGLDANAFPQLTAKALVTGDGGAAREFADRIDIFQRFVRGSGAAAAQE